MSENNVVVFPLRGRRLMAEVARVVDAAGRRLRTAEVAEAVGESSAVVYDALQSLQSCGAVKCFRENQA